MHVYSGSRNAQQNTTEWKDTQANPMDTKIETNLLTTCLRAVLTHNEGGDSRKKLSLL